MLMPMTLDRFPLLVAAASAAILLTALGFQYLGGLAPCALCIWQRWPYVAAIVLGGAALAASGRTRGVLTALAGIALLAGTGIAAFHVGVEQHWWPGLASCGGGIDYSSGSIDDLRARLMAAPVVSCDTVAWSFLGLSMAGWNFLLSLGLGLASLAAGLRLGRAHR